ncbi:oligoribonuclease, partial [Escherichia sp. TWPC-MK]
ENSMSANENNLIWIDLEMTGLDPERDRIIEIATLVTDANLNILAEGPTIAVHQSDEQLALMDDWNVRTHTASGLVERVKASTMGDREAELARRVGDLARMSELQYGKIPELEKQLEAATQLEGKTMRLLRNKVTDAEIAAVFRARFPSCEKPESPSNAPALQQ